MFAPSWLSISRSDINCGQTPFVAAQVNRILNLQSFSATLRKRLLLIVEVSLLLALTQRRHWQPSFPPVPSRHGISQNGGSRCVSTLKRSPASAVARDHRCPTICTIGLPLDQSLTRKGLRAACDQGNIRTLTGSDIGNAHQTVSVQIAKQRPEGWPEITGRVLRNADRNVTLVA